MNTTLDRLLREANARQQLPDPKIRRWLREQARLSQRDVAEVLGVTRACVTRWETGAREPRGELLLRYAKLLQRLSAEACR